MENKDLIIEAILSIEDFNNVDQKLMETINSDSEYRRIFEEYKEISVLTSECVPVPEKNGVTLHDAVMNRVRNGDTAPRYINTSAHGKFGFPMATAASLAIVLVVAVIATNVTRMNKGHAPAEKLMLFDAAEDSGYVEIQNAEFKSASVREESAPETEVYTTDTAMSGEYEFAAYSVNDEETETIAVEDGVEAVSENGSLRKDSTVAYDAQNVPAQGAASYADTTDDIPVTSGGGAKKRAESQEKPEQEAEVAPEIASRLAFANKHSIPEENKITAEDIEAYGMENFIAWFDSIADGEDFTDKYSKKQFIRYCTELWATE